MTEYAPAIVAVAVVAFAAVSKRLGRSALTGTMLFTAVGLAIGPQGLDLLPLTGLLGQGEVINLVLTATLVVVLFTDASAVNASKWSEEILPARLLGIGLPLAIVFGWLVAYLLFDLEFWEAAVLGTMLAPTDAALGKAVVSNPRVPVRIRQALNVESGLNDGIALPFFLVFLETAQAVESSLDVSQLVTEVVKQLGVAIVVGVVVGFGGARIIRWGRTSGNAIGYWLQDRTARPRPRRPTPWPHRSADRGSSPRGSPASPSVGRVERTRRNPRIWTNCRCTPSPPGTC